MGRCAQRQPAGPTLGMFKMFGQQGHRLAKAGPGSVL